MTSRERLMAAIQGLPVDRCPVNLYEIGGFNVDVEDPDPFNVYNDPSWQPLLRLAEEESDIIRMRSPRLTCLHQQIIGDFIASRQYMENGSLFTETEFKVGGRVLTSLTRRDPDVNTVWTLKHFLSDSDDVHAYLQLPDELFAQSVDVSNLFAEDDAVGDRGIVMVDTADPLCMAAGLFSMEDYTVIALTEQELFQSLLEKLFRNLYRVVEETSRLFPGHMWRICGPEYASEPYLPPRLFEEYVVRYTKPMVESIARYGGYARIHSHGRLKNILPHIADMGASALDPIEPPPHGDMLLSDVKREYGRDMTLFGNLEICDIENMEPADFEEVVKRSIEDGMEGSGKGFVLMPSASPYGRVITPRTLTNYGTMVRLATNHC